VKGAGPQREINPPGNWIAPPGSNWSGGGGNKAAGASGVEGRIRLFEVLMERGKYPSAMLFDYDTAGGKVQLIDLKKQFAEVLTSRCNTTFDVAATTETTAIVIELNSAEPCASSGLWLLDPTGKTVRRVPQGTSFRSLFKKVRSGSLSVRN